MLDSPKTYQIAQDPYITFIHGDFKCLIHGLTKSFFKTIHIYYQFVRISCEFFSSQMIKYCGTLKYYLLQAVVTLLIIIIDIVFWMSLMKNKFIEVSYILILKLKKESILL